MSDPSKPNQAPAHSRAAVAGRPPEQHRPLVGCRNLFYVSLTLLVLVDLLDTAARFGQSFRTADVLAGVAPLDSFSQPAVATTLLRREADDLFSRFTEARNDAEYPGATPFNQTETSRTRTPPDAGGPKLREMSAAEIQVLQRLERLRVTIRGLNQDVDEKLLVIDIKNGNGNDLVDCFLELLHNCPERPEILEWVDPALDAAQSLGRAEEVQDALEHVLRFGGSLPTAWGLKARMERRKAALSSVRTTSQP